MKEEILEKLNIFNDSNFIFDEPTHKYTYLGKEYISVTRYIEQFHKPFDQNYHSLRIAQKRGVPQEWVLSEWKELNDYANYIGHETHLWIENYFLQKWQNLPTNLDIIHRINKFNKIYATNMHKLIPIAFEVRVFSKKWKIAGMIDALFLYRNQIFIIDYKTNKEFTTDSNLKYKERLRYPFESYYKTHLNEYSIQISLYALILKEYNINVAGGYLVYIGPGDDDAQIYKCVNLTSVLEEFLNVDRTF
jgi:ATP-dependent exoDNAse (exonuclease V) beta subunit